MNNNRNNSNNGRQNPRGGRPQGGQRPNYGQQPADPNRFVVNISDEDYEGDGSGRRQRADRGNQRYQRLAPQQRPGANDPNSQALLRKDIPVSRTRVITSRAGEKYEIPEENNLPPKLLRRTRNTSLILPAVIEKIAQLKGISAEEVEQAAAENAIRLFNLSVSEKVLRL